MNKQLVGYLLRLLILTEKKWFDCNWTWRWFQPQAWLRKQNTISHRTYLVFIKTNMIHTLALLKGKFVNFFISLSNAPKYDIIWTENENWIYHFIQEILTFK